MLHGAEQKMDALTSKLPATQARIREIRQNILQAHGRMHDTESSDSI